MKSLCVAFSTLLLSGVVGARTVIIGDSMFWSGMLFFGGQPSPLSKCLESLAGHSIENHALVGASLEDGWVKSIPQQYHDMMRSNPTPTITTLLMDGGGNDVMSHKNDCVAFNEKCTQVIDQSVEIARSLMNEAMKDGTTNVVYLGPYYLSDLSAAVNYTVPKLVSVCDSIKNLNGSIGCHFVDTRYNETSKTGLPTPEMIGPDGIHPTNEGYTLLAHMMWDTIVENNIPV